MLSIGLVSSSAAAVSYFEKDDYYHAEGGESPEMRGRWYGEGAQELGLKGPVERAMFERLLEGRLPDGSALGTFDQEGVWKHTPGWDMTFSAPKSVSILAEIGQDERLFKAHERAVLEALEWTQQHSLGMRARTSVGRLFLRTQSMVAALFTHHTSRNQDPNLHTHSVLANLTQRWDGKWVSVHSRPLFDSKMAIGVIYRAALAREVLRLGYDIEQTHRDGRFEIQGVSRALIKAMSTRRTEIESELKKMGVDDAASAALAALLTRTRKKVVNHGELVKVWREFAAEAGIDIDTLVKAAMKAGAQPPVGRMDLDVALTDALDRLSESETRFSHANVARYALASLVGSADIKAVEAAIERAKRDGRLLQVDEGGLQLWTTPRAQEQERRIIAALLKGQGTRVPMMGSSDVHDALQASILNAKQKAAVEHILTATDQFIGIQGLPGVGKTTLLKPAKELADQQGFTMVGMAQNASAAENLELETGMAASTIHRHLIRIARDLALTFKGNTAQLEEVRRRYATQVWVVDEASQLPNGLVRRLMFNAEKLGASVVFVGDTKQLPAIEAGKPFVLLIQEGMKTVTVDEIHRQKNPDHVAIVHASRAGKIREVFQQLGRNVVEVKQHEERLEAMLAAFKHLDQAGRANALLLTARNTDKAALNDGVRKILTEEAKISGEQSREQLVRVVSSRADRRDAMFYTAGWIVRFGKAIPSLGIGKDEYWQVTGVRAKDNIVTLKRADGGSGEVVEWNPRDVGVSGKLGVQLFKRRDTHVAVGEPVRWLRNSRELGLLNGEVVRTVSVNSTETIFEKASGQRVTVTHDSVASGHWEHAYASTIFSSQGRTVIEAIINADSDLGDLFSQKALVVALSRHKHRLTVFTDDRDKLVTSLEEHAGDKTSARESRHRSAVIWAAQMARQLMDEWRSAMASLSRLAPARAPS